jgi:hypothetical protein
MRMFRPVAMLLALMLVASGYVLSYAPTHAQERRINIPAPPTIGAIMSGPVKRAQQEKAAPPPSSRYTSNGLVGTLDSQDGDEKPKSSSVLGIAIPAGIGLAVALACLFIMKGFSKPPPKGDTTLEAFSNTIAAEHGRMLLRGELPKLTPLDSVRFSSIIIEVQQAFSSEDLDYLREVARADLVNQIEETIEKNRTDGVSEQITSCKVLGDDVIRHWAEGPREFVSIGARLKLTNVVYDRSTGGIVSGHPDEYEEIEQIWTYERPPNGRWVAIGIVDVA